MVDEYARRDSLKSESPCLGLTKRVVMCAACGQTFDRAVRDDHEDKDGNVL